VQSECHSVSTREEDLFSHVLLQVLHSTSRKRISLSVTKKSRLRDNDLKTISKSKDVPGAVQTAAKQQLSRKGK
jgi:hypothetical protein